MLPNKGLVDALYERMFGDSHQQSSDSDSKYSSTKDISGDSSIQQNSWAQNEIRQRIIDAPNNKHAQRKHDLLDERTAGFKNVDEGDFGNDQQNSGFGQTQEWSTSAGQNQEWSGAPQSQNWSSGVPQNQSWSGIGQDIQSQGLSGQSFSGYSQGVSGLNQQSSGIDSAQGLGTQGISQQQSWNGSGQNIPFSQQGQQQFGQGYVPTYEEQRYAPPLPNRQF